MRNFRSKGAALPLAGSRGFRLRVPPNIASVREKPESVGEGLLMAQLGLAQNSVGVQLSGRVEVESRGAFSRHGHFSASSNNTFRISGWAVGALHPVFEAPAVSVSMRTRRRSPLHAQRNWIRQLQ